MLLNYTNFSRAQFSMQRYCFFLIPQNIFEKKVKKTKIAPLTKQKIYQKRGKTNQLSLREVCLTIRQSLTNN